MRLKEMAEEDIYFARRDRELIQALRRKQAEEAAREAIEAAGGKRRRALETTG
jgi:hypothetical protein